MATPLRSKTRWTASLGAAVCRAANMGIPVPVTSSSQVCSLGLICSNLGRRCLGSVGPLHGGRQQSSRGLKADSRTSPLLRKRVGVYDRFCLALYEQVGEVRQLLRGSALSQRGMTSREFMHQRSTPPPTSQVVIPGRRSPESAIRAKATAAGRTPK